MTSTNFNYLLKYIIVGDSGVGKSNILTSYIHKKFKKDHEVTIGVEFGSKNIKIKDKMYKIQIWDTAGQEQFRSITRAYYKSAVCAFLVYDITKKESFYNIQSWVEECRNQCPSTTLLYLIGNKTDLNDIREVTNEEGKELAKKNKMSFFETSAKESYNIEEVFSESAEKIANLIHENYYNLDSEVSYI
jgi:Ras-related protein Rab-2A